MPPAPDPDPGPPAPDSGPGPPLTRWTRADGALVGTAIVGGALVLALNGAAAEVYESLAEQDDLAGLDQPVLDHVVAARTPGLTEAVAAFTHLGGPVGMSIVAALLTVLATWLWRSRTPLVLMVLAAAGSLAITATSKDLLGRTRPPQWLAVPPYESSPSFPSGHTLNSTVLVGMAAYLVVVRLRSRSARVLVVLLGGGFVLAMGLSRVYLGHHWLTDVVAGWLIGLAWLAAVVTAHRVHVGLRRGPGGPGPAAPGTDAAPGPGPDA